MRPLVSGAALLLLSCNASLAQSRERPPQQPQSDAYLFNDSHFHLTNYVQMGISIEQYLQIMGDRVKRSTLFGIPLQQTWSYANSGDFAPTYYLHTDAPLYYYSFTDAFIANAWLKLPDKDRERFDPMITGFNPADMYGADHIRRVLETFPGVFSGIGEFSVHKEFVSAKVAGETASLTTPALDRILDFAGEAGLVAILHCDIDMPFTKAQGEPIYFEQMRQLLARHPQTTIIWAHTGLGRVVQPITEQASAASAARPPAHIELIEEVLDDPRMRHVYFDISWDEVAKYATATPESISRVAALLDRYPDRFLFGTDNVAPASAEAHFKVFHMWDPVFSRIRPATKTAVTLGNYERLFDAARAKVRAWEKANLN
jgi:predicted TIM-barrel fold metal-dependent hydrolase